MEGISPFRSAFDVFDPFLDRLQLQSKPGAESEEAVEPAEPDVADEVVNIISQLQQPVFSGAVPSSSAVDAAASPASAPGDPPAAEATIPASAALPPPPAAAPPSAAAVAAAAAAAAAAAPAPAHGPAGQRAVLQAAPAVSAEDLDAINAIPPAILIRRQQPNAASSGQSYSDAASAAIAFVANVVDRDEGLQTFYATVQTRLGQMICLFAGFINSYDANLRRAVIDVAGHALPGPAGALAAAANTIADYRDNSAMTRVQTGIHDAGIIGLSSAYTFSEAVARELVSRHQEAIRRVHDPGQCKRLAIAMVKRIACDFPALASHWSGSTCVIKLDRRIELVVATASFSAAPSRFREVWDRIAGDTFAVDGGATRLSLAQLLHNTSL